jgi:hypothetical protein
LLFYLLLETIFQRLETSEIPLKILTPTVYTNFLWLLNLIPRNHMKLPQAKTYFNICHFSFIYNVKFCSCSSQTCSERLNLVLHLTILNYTGQSMLSNKYYLYLRNCSLFHWLFNDAVSPEEIG